MKMRLLRAGVRVWMVVMRPILICVRVFVHGLQRMSWWTETSFETIWKHKIAYKFVRWKRMEVGVIMIDYIKNVSPQIDCEKKPFRNVCMGHFINDRSTLHKNDISHYCIRNECEEALHELVNWCLSFFSSLLSFSQINYFRKIIRKG